MSFSPKKMSLMAPIFIALIGLSACSPKSKTAQVTKGQPTAEILAQGNNNSLNQLQLLETTTTDMGNYFQMQHTVVFGNQQKILVSQYDHYMSAIWYGNQNFNDGKTSLDVRADASCSDQTCSTVYVVLTGYQNGTSAVQKSYSVNKESGIVDLQYTNFTSSVLSPEQALDTMKF